MRRIPFKKLFPFIMLVVITFTLAIASAGFASVDRMASKTNLLVRPGTQQAAGEILVKVKSGKSLAAVNETMGGKTVEVNWQSRVQKVKLPRGTDLFSALFRYGADPNVEYVEPNYLRKFSFIPNDPELSKQWWIDKARAKQAWDISRGNPSISVAIIDSGIDMNHPDLRGKIVSPFNAVNGSADLAQVKDDIGHGTHVAGIAAAAVNNGTGVAGIGGDVKIMPIKASSGEALYDDDIAKGIYRAVDSGAKVINMSLGGTSASTTLSNAVKYAIDRNVVVVAAAGNEGSSVPNYPAAYNGVIGVAATDQYDKDAYFSNYGSYIDVSAPGVNIYSTTPTYSTSSFAINYGNASGTSMASPVVAGLAGLVFSARPDLTQSQAADLILKNSQDIGSAGWDQLTGWGRVDAYKTLLAATEKNAPAVASTDPVNNASGVSRGKVLTVTFNENIVAGANYGQITVKDASNNAIPINKSMSQNKIIIDPAVNLAPGVSHTLTIPAGAVTDAMGNAMASSHNITFTTQSDANYPVIEMPFQPSDAVLDPDRPIVYMSNKYEKKIYAINYKTGVTSALTFTQMPESLEIGRGQYAGELYVALLAQEHSSYWANESQTGSIAVIDRQSFTLKEAFNVGVDPYDIVAGRDNHIYVASGSGQWANLDAYNRTTKQLTDRTGIRQLSEIKLHPSLERIYAQEADGTPKLKAYNIVNGDFKEASYPGGYDAPIQPEVGLGKHFAIDPTGQYLFNNGGNILDTSADKTQDMKYVAKLDSAFIDIAFENDLLQVYTVPYEKEYVQIYRRDNYAPLETLPLQGRGKFLFQQSGQIVTVIEPAVPTAAYRTGLQVLSVTTEPQPAPDNTAPTGSIQINNGKAYTKSTLVDLVLSAIDVLGTVDGMQFSNDGAAWSAWEPYAPSKKWTLPSGDGVKKVYVKFRDAAGNESLVYSDTIQLDTAAPSIISVTTPLYSTNISKTTVFKISWAASDKAPASGVASYDIEYRLGGSTIWTRWKTGLTATYANFSGKSGNTYYFRLRATDKAGNAGSWTTPVYKTIVPFDNGSLIAGRKGFVAPAANTSYNYYLGTILYSTKANEELTYRFTGNKIALITTKASSRSKAKIYIDGVYKTTVDAYAPSALYRQSIYTFSWTTVGTHTIKIVNLGTTGRTRFDVDGLAVGK